MYGTGRFIGKRNRSKVKCWIYLQYLKEIGSKGATVNNIADNTGIPLRTLDSSLNKWWSWGRINKKLLDKPASDGNKHIWSITAFGIRYLQETVPVDFYNECIIEIKEYQAAKRQRLVKDAFLHGTV